MDEEQDQDPIDWPLQPMQEALLETCSSISAKRTAMMGRVDDMLVPHRICNLFVGQGAKKVMTLGSLVRIGKLLQSSMHGQLPVQDYAGIPVLFKMQVPFCLLI